MVNEKCLKLQKEIADSGKDYKLKRLWKICPESCKWEPMTGGFWTWVHPCGLRRIVNMMM